MNAALASALHMAGLVLTTVAILIRDRGLEDPSEHKNHRAIDIGDTLMIFFSMMLIGAGVWRLFGALEKPTDWYLANPYFWTKLGLVGLISAIESYLMVVFFSWRFQAKRKEALNLKNLKWVRALNRAELVISVAVIFLAAGVAHGYGSPAVAARAVAGDGCAAADLFATRCSSCHGPQVQQAGLNLQGDARGALLGVVSSLWPTQVRLVAAAPELSLLWRKIEGTQGEHGLAMPMGQNPLSPSERDIIKAWIVAGAPSCTRSTAP